MLCTQETHWTSDNKFCMGIEQARGCCTSQSGSTAVLVLDKQLHIASHVSLMKGCILLVTLVWEDGSKLVIINVYAPNDPSQYGTFCAALEEVVLDIG